MIKKCRDFQLILAALLIMMMLNTQTILSVAQTTEEERFKKAAEVYDLKQNYKEVAEALNFSRIERDIITIAGLGSRFTGYEGAWRVNEYVYENFKTLTDYAEYKNYSICVPIDEGAKVRIISVDGKPDGDVLEAIPLFPNLAQQCIVPEDGIRGRLVYVGEGSLKGEIKDSIVLMDFNTGNYWVEAAKMGAKAVIFIQPPLSTASESLSKMVYTELYFPRLLVSYSDGLRLKQLAEEHEVEISISSRIVYKEVTARNVIGFMWGSVYRNQTVIVSAYYDDWCVAPSLAAGYDSATSIALLLELARILSTFRPKRNILFLATSGHWQAAQGMRSFVREILLSGNPPLPQLPFSLGSQWNETTFFLVCLDLSTLSDALAIVSTGGLYHAPSFVAPGVVTLLGEAGLDHFYVGFMGPLATYRGFRDIYRAICDSLGVRLNVRAHATEMEGLGGTNSTGALGEYFTAIPEKYFVESEVWIEAGLPGITIYTPVRRIGWFSPTPIKDINMDNLRKQAVFIASFIHLCAHAHRSALVGSTATEMRELWGRVDFLGPIRQHAVTGAGRAGFPLGLGILRIQTHIYNASDILQYSPIGTPLAYVVDAEDVGNIFYYTFVMGSENGTLVIPDLLSTPPAAYKRRYRLRAFIVDNLTGKITHAPDFGVFGGRRFPDTLEILALDTPDVGWPTPKRIILFEAGSITLFDIFHPNVHAAEKWTDTYGLDYLAKLGNFASQPYIYPSEPGIRVYYLHSRVEATSYGATADFDRGVYTVFLPLKTPVEIHVFLPSERGILERVAILLNGTESNPEGFGISLSSAGENIIIPETLYRMAKDGYYLSKSRVDQALSYGISDEASTISVSALEQVLNKIETAKDRGNYSQAYLLQPLALYETTPALKFSENLIVGARSTALVFFILLVPFALIFQRLVGSEAYSGKKKLLIFLIIFMAFSIPFLYLHPGVALVANLPTLILGFAVEMVVLLVFLLLYMEGGKIIREYRARLRGYHFFEKSKLETAVFMFTYGVSQMRRRKFIFLLIITSLTLISMSSVLFFSTSALPLVITKERSWPQDLPWPGNYLHVSHAMGKGLSTYTVKTLESLVGSEGKVALVTYVYPPLPNRPQKNNYFSVVSNGKTWRIPLIVGLSPEIFTLPLYQGSIMKGDLSAFKTVRENPYVSTCLISSTFSKESGISVGDRLSLGGVDFLVVAVFDDRVMDSVRDYPNPTVRQLPEDLNMRAEHETPGEIREKVYLSWDKVLIIPFEDCERLFNAKPSKAFVISNNISVLDSIARHLILNSFNTNIILGVDNKVSSYTTTILIITRGTTSIFIPLALGALIVANVILSFLSTRTRELGILSSLGASPTHAVAMLLAEVSTYAILSTVLGYMAGMLFIRILNPPISPNFLSEYVLFVLGVQLLFMFIATIPFLTKVSRAVTPSLERRWRIPTKPKGDLWVIPTPFTSTFDEAPAILYFIKEWLDSHGVRETTATFVSLGPAKFVKDAGVMKIICPIMLPPWEAGLIQDFELISVGERDRSNFTFQCRLKSGPRELWLRANLSFIRLLREQFLLWTGLSSSEKEKYKSLAFQNLK